MKNKAPVVEETGEKSPLWIISFADMISLLMAFFVMLLTMAHDKSGKIANEGEGIFEIPVGPVHAGIIGPGHFRFSVAGEPIISLETRLGWKHRGIEKVLESKNFSEAVKIFECISGDTAFGYSTAFCQSVEKILGVDIPIRSQIIRVLCLELERLYNHANDMGGIALDVGFTFPAQFASLIKEAILQLNENLSGSRYLKGINTVGRVTLNIDRFKAGLIREALIKIQKDSINEIKKAGFESVDYFDFINENFEIIKNNTESKRIIAILTAATIDAVRLIDNVQI